eukprot:75018_1
MALALAEQGAKWMGKWALKKVGKTLIPKGIKQVWEKWLGDHKGHAATLCVEVHDNSDNYIRRLGEFGENKYVTLNDYGARHGKIAIGKTHFFAWKADPNYRLKATHNLSVCGIKDHGTRGFVMVIILVDENKFEMEVGYKRDYDDEWKNIEFSKITIQRKKARTGKSYSRITKTGGWDEARFEMTDEKAAQFHIQFRKQEKHINYKYLD